MKKYIITMLIGILIIAGCAQEFKPAGQQDVQDPRIGQQNTQQPPLSAPYVTGTYIEQMFEPTAPTITKTFASEKELSDFIRSHSGSGMYYGGIADGFDMGIKRSFAESAPPMVPNAAGVASEQAASDRDYSQTNNQVADVDEADIIKTDGEYIYTITGQTLFIIKAYPGEDAEILSRTKLPGNPQGLFIDGNTIAVFGDFYDEKFFEDVGYNMRNGMTFLNLYDNTDKKDPKISKEYKFEGNYMNGRMTGDDMYLVVNSQPNYVRPLPIMFEGDVMRTMPIEKIHYFSIPYDYPTYVSVHSVNLKTLENTDSQTMTVESGQNLYMSQSSMYITYTEYVNEYEIEQSIIQDLLYDKLPNEDKQLIQKIKGADNDILSQGEKEAKVMEVFNSYIAFLPLDEQDTIRDQVEELLEKKLEEFEHFEYTIINRLKVDDGMIEITGSGKVPGHIMNQFSMDEDQNGVFRIATSLNQRWSRFGKQQTESTNNVYTIDSDMRIMGRLEGLAEGESIFSTRFMGDKLYMVTFEQIDPFFVIDLSDPQEPVELGQLKIPGFSRYLHPYDDNTIIGIGKDASATGRERGLKISLFDVSDFTKPKEIAKFVTDERYADSTALYEHKAFLFSREKGLLVIPAFSQDYRNAEQGYNGAFVFDISKDSIELRGLIDHSKGISNYYGAAVERSLFIEELLYTKSPGLLRINALDNLHGVKDITLQATSANVPIY